MQQGFDLEAQQPEGPSGSNSSREALARLGSAMTQLSEVMETGKAPGSHYGIPEIVAGALKQTNGYFNVALSFANWGGVETRYAQLASSLVGVVATLPQLVKDTDNAAKVWTGKIGGTPDLSGPGKMDVFGLGSQWVQLATTATTAVLAAVAPEKTIATAIVSGIQTIASQVETSSTEGEKILHAIQAQWEHRHTPSTQPENPAASAADVRPTTTPPASRTTTPVARTAILSPPALRKVKRAVR